MCGPQAFAEKPHTPNAIDTAAQRHAQPALALQQEAMPQE
jgi:hypothetical protein